MGFASFMDDVFGFDNEDAQWEAEQRANQQRMAAAAAAVAAKNSPPVAPVAPPIAPVAPPVAAPVAPIAPIVPVFDPAPYRSQVEGGFSQFTPEFYANKYASFFDPYKTNVAGQYDFAKDALTAGIAKRGLANSQQGRGLFQQLDALRDQSLGQGQSAAQGFQTSLADQVNRAKEGLYGSIGAGADNASIGARTQAEANRIAGTATPANTLGDIFGGLVQPYAASRSPGGPVNPEETAFATGSNLNLANVGGGPAASARVVGAPRRRKF